MWTPPDILKKRLALPIQYMTAESKKKLALALWAVGIRKAKIMSDIMRAFNLIERDIYIRGAEAKIDFTMYEKHDDEAGKQSDFLLQLKINKRPFYMISPLGYIHFLH